MSLNFQFHCIQVRCLDLCYYFCRLLLLFPDLIPLSDEKYDHIMRLKRFCDDPNADIFYSQLPHVPSTEKKRLKQDMKINRKVPTKKKQEPETKSANEE